MLGICEHGVAAPVWQVVGVRACAMVSTLLMAASNVVTVLRKGTPGPAAPAYMEMVRPDRPCDSGKAGLAALAGLWHPVQTLVSPGTNCSQLVCCGPMRRAFLSRISMVNGTFAGSCIRTDPSGSIGA